MDAELQKRINISSAAGWNPAPGQTLIGTVEHIASRDTQYGTHPVITLAAETDDPETVTYVAVHAYHSTLKTALYDLKPAKGQRLAITYHGRRASRSRKDSNGNPVEYHSYTVTDPDAVADETPFAWNDNPEF